MDDEILFDASGAAPLERRASVILLDIEVRVRGLDKISESDRRAEVESLLQHMPALRAIADEILVGASNAGEKLRELEWHLKACVGLAETNGHPFEMHHAWARQAVGKLRMSTCYGRLWIAEAGGGGTSAPE